MRAVPKEHIQKTISVLGRDGIAQSDVESSVAAFAESAMSARRLIDWIPEVFSIVLIPHVGLVNLPKTFSAKAENGEWQVFDFDKEPIFKNTLPIAIEMYHSGLSKEFTNIVNRSALLDTVNKALNSGASINGSTLSGPALVGIPAEFYQDKKRPLWHRFLGVHQEA